MKLSAGVGAITMPFLVSFSLYLYDYWVAFAFIGVLFALATPYIHYHLVKVDAVFKLEDAKRRSQELTQINSDSQGDEEVYTR
jgi:hypothetical protein